MASTEPNSGLTYNLDYDYPIWPTQLDDDLKRLGAIIQLTVKSRTTTTPPGSPSNGDRYAVPASATGAWAGQTGSVTIWIDGAWEFYTPKKGWSLVDETDTTKLYIYDGANWTAITGSSPSVMVASGAGHASGLTPDTPSSAGTVKYLREDATWAVPVGTTYNDFVGSGASHAHGLVPDPGATAGTTKFLREDGSWSVPPSSGGSTSLDPNCPDNIPASPNTMDDEFQTTSLDAKWSTVNLASTTITVGNGAARFQSNYGTTENNTMIVQSTPTAPYTFACKVSMMGGYTRFPSVGMFVRDSATGKFIRLAYVWDSSTSQAVVEIDRYNNPTTYVSTDAVQRVWCQTVYFKIVDDNTNRSFHWSPDGKQYFQLFSAVRTTHITPNQIGVGFNPFDFANAFPGTPLVASIDWFRRLA